MSDPLASVRARFAARVRQDLAVIDAGSPDAVRQATHRLAGLAGTLGYADLGRLAMAADEALQAGGDAGPELAALRAAMADFLLTHG